jgi:hypothetical protein
MNAHHVAASRHINPYTLGGRTKVASIAAVQVGARQEVRFAQGGKVMEGRTHNNASDTLQALATCADDRLGQGRPIVSGCHGRERR